jgi:hypothetical protein
MVIKGHEQDNQLKKGGTENLESSSRRLVRGFAAAQVMMTILATNFNLRKIAGFIHDLILDDAGRRPWGPLTPKGRARDSKHRNAYTNTYPPGVTPPKTTKRTLGDDDGTGGPPLRT